MVWVSRLKRSVFATTWSSVRMSMSNWVIIRQVVVGVAI